MFSSIKRVLHYSMGPQTSNAHLEHPLVYGGYSVALTAENDVFTHHTYLDSHKRYFRPSYWDITTVVRAPHAEFVLRQLFSLLHLL